MLAFRSLHPDKEEIRSSINISPLRGVLTLVDLNSQQR